MDKVIEKDEWGVSNIERDTYTLKFLGQFLFGQSTNDVLMVPIMVSHTDLDGWGCTMVQRLFKRDFGPGGKSGFPTDLTYEYNVDRPDLIAGKLKETIKKVVDNALNSTPTVAKIRFRILITDLNPGARNMIDFCKHTIEELYSNGDAMMGISSHMPEIDEACLIVDHHPLPITGYEEYDPRGNIIDADLSLDENSRGISGIAWAEVDTNKSATLSLYEMYDERMVCYFIVHEMTDVSETIRLFHDIKFIAEAISQYDRGYWDNDFRGETVSVDLGTALHMALVAIRETHNSGSPWIGWLQDKIEKYHSGKSALIKALMNDHIVTRECERVMNEYADLLEVFRPVTLTNRLLVAHDQCWPYVPKVYVVPQDNRENNSLIYGRSNAICVPDEIRENVNRIYIGVLAETPQYFSILSREIMAALNASLLIIFDNKRGTVMLRSDEKINCTNIARINGGNGHPRAAGFKITDEHKFISESYNT